MTQAQKDTQRVMAVAKALLDDRHPVKDMSEILVTLDHLVAMILVAATNGDPHRAVTILHEGLLPHVEERIALYQSRSKKGATG